MTRRLMTAALACLLLAGPAFSATESERPRVELVTSLGNIEVELFEERAPRTVENFLRLVEDGFYDGLVFHRVVAGFVIQTGGYEPGLEYREPPGTIANESFNGLRNLKGTLAMARQADPDSADAQFFINVKTNPHLDAAPGSPGYAVFGRVVDGWDVVTDIELTNTSLQGGMAGVPEEPVVIEEARRVN